MNFLPVAVRFALMLVAALLLQGCWPAGTSNVDEQKEPHFLLGQSRVNSLDFKGAIEAFEKALEVNPKSGAAHFELALLYEQRENNSAAAIYHYEKFLQLRPGDARADIVRPRITACKQELAKSFLIAPGSQNAQKDLEKMKLELERASAENMQLRRQVEQLQAATGGAAPVISGRKPTPADAAAFPRPSSPGTAVAATPPDGARPVSKSAGDAKTYTVKAGDTPVAIAKKHGIKLEALLSANPNLNPVKMQIGQTLNIPAQ